MGDGVDSLDRLIKCSILGQLLNDDEVDVFGMLGVCKRRGQSAWDHLLCPPPSFMLTLLKPGVGFGLRANGTAHCQVNSVSAMWLGKPDAMASERSVGAERFWRGEGSNEYGFSPRQPL